MTIQDKARLRIRCEQKAVEHAKKTIAFVSIGKKPMASEVVEALEQYAASGAAIAFETISEQGFLPVDMPSISLKP